MRFSAGCREMQKYKWKCGQSNQDILKCKWNQEMRICKWDLGNA